MNTKNGSTGGPEQGDGRTDAAATLMVLRRREGWADAVRNLSELVATHGARARTAAADYADFYTGRRGAMVFDVVASRQRQYEGRVLPMVQRWEQGAEAPTLRAMASGGLEAKEYGLQRAEPVTMHNVASNLLAFAALLGMSEDDACRVWADGVEGLEHAHKLDPIVGAVSGIGPALFAYMRMRCGANALKPDLRVVAALRQLGFALPGDPHSVLVIARGAAAEVDLDLLSLDQLLWYSSEQPPTASSAR